MSELQDDSFDPFDIAAEAIDTGDLSILQQLRDLIVNGQVDVNAWCDEVTLLGMVAEAGDLELVQLMLERGADVNLSTKSDASTALMDAATGGNIEIVRLLVSAGANVNEIRGGDSVLARAVRAGHEEMIQFLSPINDPVLRQKAQCQRREPYEKLSSPISPLVSDLFEVITDGNLDKIRELIACGVDVNASNEWDVNSVNFAASIGRFNIVNILLQAGANPNLGEVGSPALLNAAGFGDPEAVEALIKAGANVNTVMNGRTALMQAVEWAFPPDDRKVVQLLIEAGSDLEIQDEYGNTAVAIAVYTDKDYLVEMLLKAGVKDTKLSSAYLLKSSRSGNVGRVKELLQVGADVNVTDTNGFTALACAADAGHREVVRLLIEAGADIEAREKTGATPLMIAVDKARIEVIRELLQAGADVRAVDNYDRTVFDRAYNAAKQKSIRREILKIIKEYGKPG